LPPTSTIAKPCDLNVFRRQKQQLRVALVRLDS